MRTERSIRGDETLLMIRMAGSIVKGGNLAGKANRAVGFLNRVTRLVNMLCGC
jgi:hypothetical protein